MSHSRALSRAGEPEGLGPNATRCLRSSKARPPLKPAGSAGVNDEATPRHTHAATRTSKDRRAVRLSLSTLFLPFPAPIDQPGKPNAHDIEPYHGNPKHKQRGKVGSGCDGSGGDGRQEHRVSQLLNEEFGSDDSKEREDENNDRKLKDHTDANDDGHRDTPILVDGHHRLE